MVSPGAPGARTPSGGAGAAGCAGGSMPGRKLPGKLEQLEPAGASLLHNSRAAATARRGGAAHRHQPGPPPRLGRAAGRGRAPGGGSARPRGPGDPLATPGPAPGAPAPASPSPLLQPRAPGWGLWAPVRGRGSRRRVSGDLATAAPVTAPARPLAALGQFYRRACGPRYPGRRAAT